MYIAPIDGAVVEDALPQKTERSLGVHAWGMKRLRPGRYLLALIETGFVFVCLPLLALSPQGGPNLPYIMGLMLTSTAILLSATRSFHWRDLLPVELWSEWRLIASMGGVFAASAFTVTSFYWPERLLDPRPETLAMLAVFPIVTAIPMELVYRALFFRRYGRLIRGEPLAIFLGACATALGYAVLAGSLAGVVFGFGLGLVLGWAYLRTGNFALSVILHWMAAAAVYVIGPGLL